MRIDMQIPKDTQIKGMPTGQQALVEKIEKMKIDIEKAKIQKENLNKKVDELIRQSRMHPFSVAGRGMRTNNAIESKMPLTESNLKMLKGIYC